MRGIICGDCGHSIKRHNINGCNHGNSNYVFCHCKLNPIEIRKMYFNKKRKKFNKTGGAKMRTDKLIVEADLRKDFQALLKRLKDYIEPNSKENFKILLDDVIYKLSFEDMGNLITKEVK